MSPAAMEEGRWLTGKVTGGDAAAASRRWTDGGSGDWRSETAARGRNALVANGGVELNVITAHVSEKPKWIEAASNISVCTTPSCASSPGCSTMKQSTIETLYPDENVSLCLSSSSNQHPSVCHSTFESLRLGSSSQSIASSFLCLWDSLNFKKDREFVGITFLFLNENLNSVIHGFTPVGRANHYMPSLKAGSIVKVDRFEVARCSSMYKITDHPFFICFISLTIIDEVITGAPETNLQSIRLFDNLQVIMWLDKSVMSRALTSPKKQFESLSVSLLIYAYEED
ncbi:hypothetical protein F2Q69_00012135 [Brassica cretica]|uniref:Uncharacterized protein n=1 Tax=Brassica cretica TaxID=69181 RepID=A0A8S9R7X7_BRACR|nr:hypothetical protein F2Q69_00012135 [Brassica cretica]